jgi:hypothetical protein
MELRYRGSQGSSIIGNLSTLVPFFNIDLIFHRPSVHSELSLNWLNLQIHDDEPPEIKEDEDIPRNNEVEKVIDYFFPIEVI